MTKYGQVRKGINRRIDTCRLSRRDSKWSRMFVFKRDKSDNSWETFEYKISLKTTRIDLTEEIERRIRINRSVGKGLVSVCLARQTMVCPPTKTHRLNWNQFRTGVLLRYDLRSVQNPEHSIFYLSKTKDYFLFRLYSKFTYVSAEQEEEERKGKKFAIGDKQTLTWTPSTFENRIYFQTFPTKNAKSFFLFFFRKTSAHVAPASQTCLRIYVGQRAEYPPVVSMLLTKKKREKKRMEKRKGQRRKKKEGNKKINGVVKEPKRID
ncbi:hypothetical protein V1478_018611 [Vespula squamosa]|uniref:Uncharacterized protein n=1 Tax=Vespula squamosa TaxID=30214 RepID=A0ABD1ZVQ7_VESSQ